MHRVGAVIRSQDNDNNAGASFKLTIESPPCIQMSLLYSFTPVSRKEGSLAIVVRPLHAADKADCLQVYRSNHTQQYRKEYSYVLVSKRFLRSHASTWGCHAMQSVIRCLLCWLRIVRLYSLDPLRFPDKITFPIIYFFWLNIEYV